MELVRVKGFTIPYALLGLYRKTRELGYRTAGQVLQRLRTSCAFDPREITRILVVRVDRLGDTLLTTPMFHALRQNFPNAEICALVTSYNRIVLEQNPDIDILFVLEDEGKHRKTRERLRFIHSLRDRHFDLVLDPHTYAHLRPALFAFLAGGRYRVGFDYEGRGFLFTHSVPIPSTYRYEADRNLDLLRALGLTVPGYSMVLRFSEEEERFAQDFFRTHGRKDGERWVGIHLTAGSEYVHTQLKRAADSKVLPLSCYTRAAEELVQRLACRILLSGTKEDSEAADRICRSLPGVTVNIAGKVSFRHLGVLLRNCAAALVPDTGVLHLAVAAGVPVVAVFGQRDPRNPPERWLPLDPKASRVLKDVGCRECNMETCCDFRCIQAITSDDIVHAMMNVADRP